MIRAHNASSAYQRIKEQLSLPEKADQVTFLAQMMRTLCSTYCPLPRRVLLRLGRDLVGPVANEKEHITTALEHALESLFQAGDIFESNQLQLGDEKYVGDWVLLTPPAFVVSESKARIFFVGIAPLQADAIPEPIKGNIEYAGAYRYVPFSESTVALLAATGLRQLPTTLWNSQPKVETPQTFLTRLENALVHAPAAGQIDGIRVLTPATEKRWAYRERWREPSDESGVYVCRRPSMYGAEHWCFAQLQAGEITKFVDLPLQGGKERACDVAWQTQLALDARDGHPAQYKMEEVSDGVSVRFSFPIPLWAQRRFERFCEVSSFPNAYKFQRAEWETEKKIIEDRLWFVKGK